MTAVEDSIKERNLSQDDLSRPRIVAIILAAGESKRMGRSKQLLPWGNTTILGQTIDHVQAADLDGVLVVTGALRAEVGEIAAMRGVQTVHNPDFAIVDLMGSLQTGLKYLLSHQSPAAVVVILGDLPFITPEVIDQVTAAYRAGHGPIVVPTYRGRRGHPVLFGEKLFDAILKFPPGGRPRELLAARETEVAELAVNSEGILRDIDTPLDYDRWRQQPE